MVRPDINELPRIAIEFEQARPLAAFFEATTGAIPNHGIPQAIELLSWLFSTGYDPTADRFVRKYLPGPSTANLNIAEGITVELPTDRDFIGLLLAELHQNTGNIEAAVNVVEQLNPSTVAAVSWPNCTPSRNDGTKS